MEKTSKTSNKTDYTQSKDAYDGSRESASYKEEAHKNFIPPSPNKKPPNGK